MSRLGHVLFGYLFMELRGTRIDDVLTDLQREGVELHDVRLRASTCTVGIGLRDFELFYRVCRNHRVKIRFIGREGLPFLLSKLKRRKAFVAGLGLFAFCLYLMSSIVWQVNVAGAEEETRMAVLQAARDAGLYRGAWKWNVSDVTRIQSELLRKMPSLMWVGVQVQGGKANLEVLPKIPGTETPSATPCDVVAGKPAVIRKVYADRGQVLVKPGQVVKPGTVVISGVLADGVKQVPAEGQVWAEVWYTSRVEIPLQVTQSALTGTSVQRDYVVIGPLHIRAWGWEQPEYPASFERDNQTEWKIGSFVLPIQLKKVTLYEATAQQVAHSEQEAAEKALELAGQDVRGQMMDEGQILGQTVLQPQVTHGKLYETVLTRTEEDIGVRAPIHLPEKSEGTKPGQN